MFILTFEGSMAKYKQENEDMDSFELKNISEEISFISIEVEIRGQKLENILETKRNINV